MEPQIGKSLLVLQQPKIFGTQRKLSTPSIRMPLDFILCENRSTNTNRGRRMWHLTLTNSLLSGRKWIYVGKLYGIILVMVYNTQGLKKLTESMTILPVSTRSLILYEGVYWARDLFPLWWKYVLNSVLRKIVQMPWVFCQPPMLVLLPLV